MDWNIATPMGAVNSGNDLATLCENMVNFSPVTPEFTGVVGVHLVVDQHWS